MGKRHPANSCAPDPVTGELLHPAPPHGTPAEDTRFNILSIARNGAGDEKTVNWFCSGNHKPEVSSGAARHHRVLLNGDAVSRRSVARLPAQRHQASLQRSRSVPEICSGPAGPTPDPRMTRVHQEVEAAGQVPRPLQ